VGSWQELQLRDTLACMCGRFTLHASPEALATLFELPEPPELAPRYNIAPTQPIAIVRMDAGAEQREWTHVLWGLIPSWSKDPSIASRMINARAETAAEKPSFRAAMRRRRCLVPVDGFYEWRKEGKRKQPFYVTMQDDAAFAFAGLWEVWAGPDGGVIESCTILTTEPNELMEAIHNRMPVIVAREDHDEWLAGGVELRPPQVSALQHLLRPFPADNMKAHAVSQYVNNPRNEGEACIVPDPEGAALGG
jgi:putative SOS response-associated peptidase YedK